MNAEFLILCDYASEMGGKLTLVGTFDKVIATSLPSGPFNLGIGLRLRLAPEDLRPEPHPFVIQLLGPDGRAVASLAGHVVTPPPKNKARSQTPASTQLALNLMGVEAKRYGQYAVELSVAGQPMCSADFWVTSD